MLTREGRCSRLRRAALASSLAIAGGLLAATPAIAVTLQLVFPDGQPMTYGSACSGDGCLARGAGLGTTDAAGEVVLADSADHIVEYRREGLDLTQVLAGTASGQVRGVDARATVVLPRMLFGSAPAVDAAESDLVARINAERSAQGLAPAVLDARLSRAADLQATWLAGSAIGLALPALSHLGPFANTPAFRLGEVSFPEPATGGEIAAAGATPAQAMTMWLASAPHRDQLLAPDAPLIGVGEVGSVIIVDLHAPCRGCQPDPLGGGAPGALSPTGVPATTSGGVNPGAPAARNAANRGSSSSASSSSSSSSSSCRVEQLRVQRMRTRRGRLRLSVGVQCLRPGDRYTLSILQRPARTVLARRRIRGAGTLLLALRPSRTTRSLRVKLKRNGRAVLARSISRRRVIRR